MTVGLLAHAEGRLPRLTVEGRARAVHALQNGRDRSGVSRAVRAPILSAAAN
jgi:hypothetical protein